MEELRELLRECLTPNLYQIVLSGATDRTAPLPAGDVRPLHLPAQKRKVRPVMLKGELLFQVTSYDGSQVFHENLTSRQAAEALAWDMMAHFKQLQAEGSGFSMTMAVSKKGKVTVKRKKSRQEETRRVELSHNRTKRYLLQEGKPVLFLVDWGYRPRMGGSSTAVMTNSGRSTVSWNLLKIFCPYSPKTGKFPSWISAVGNPI